MTRAAKAGRIDGDVNGIVDSMMDARSAFIRRPELAESDWPTYRDAYDKAYRHSIKLMGRAS